MDGCAEGQEEGAEADRELEAVTDVAEGDIDGLVLEWEDDEGDEEQD